MQILTRFIFLVLFLKKNHSFIEKGNPSEKVLTFGEKLDCIGKDDIGNLKDSARIVFINKECGNLIVVNNGGELTTSINQKKKSDVLQ